MFTKKALTSVTFAAASVLVSIGAVAGERIVVLTADVAEIVVALGRAPEVVGRDRVATQAELAHAKEVGSSRSLNPEPIVRLQPSLVIGSQLAMPEGIWEQLRSMGLKAVKLGARPDGSDYADTIRRVGALLRDDSRAERLASDWQVAMRSTGGPARRILITYEGKTVAGRATPADVLIRAAGGINAAADLDGYKPLDAEAMARLAPDLILVAEHNRAVYGGLAALKQRADIAATPAGKTGRVYEVAVHEFFTINLASPAAVRKLKAMS
ncbi:heme/hemin ABC transporter substrate-binding protein [Chitinimonas arctica]|nr:ABC transporter substrate-binding protein [Chitinimonas arctica]